MSEANEANSEYELGYNRFSEVVHNWQYMKPDDLYQGHDWTSEYDKGFKDAKRHHVLTTLKLSECLDRVHEICKEYGVVLNPGCGCCGGAYAVKDKDGKEWEFSVCEIGGGETGWRGEGL